jgi:hypothetical protein
MLVYFMTIWSILWSFCIIYGRLVCLDQEKSGNPELKVYWIERNVDPCVQFVFLNHRPIPRRDSISLPIPPQADTLPLDHAVKAKCTNRLQ